MNESIRCLCIKRMHGVAGVEFDLSDLGIV